MIPFLSPIQTNMFLSIHKAIPVNRDSNVTVLKEHS